MAVAAPGNDGRADALREEIVAFLGSHHTLALATVAADGSAHGTSMLYAQDGLSLVWTSDARSRHSLHLQAQARVTATIAPDYSDFTAIRGVQMSGEAACIAEAQAIARARALLSARYPFLGQLASAPAALRAAWDKASFYRLVPSRITLIDNTRGFGHKATLRVAGDGGVALEGQEPRPPGAS